MEVLETAEDMVLGFIALQRYKKTVLNLIIWILNPFCKDVVNKSSFPGDKDFKKINQKD